jgi:hypothetical protein
MLTNLRFAARGAMCSRRACALGLSGSKSLLETVRSLRRYRNSLPAFAAALLVMTAGGVSAQKAAPTPTPTPTPNASNTITLPSGTTITANPTTGEITVNLPKTDTTVKIDTKNNNRTSAKDNTTQKPLPKKPPAKPAANPPVNKPMTPNAGGGKPGGGGKGSIVVTPNPDGSMTVTVTNGGQTETITVNPEKDPQTGGTTTTVSSPEDPKSSVSVTNDKNGNTTGTKAKIPNPTGGGYVVGSPGSDGIGHIDTVDDNGNVTGGTTYDGNTQKVEKGPDGVPHIVAKTPEEIKKDQEAKAAKAKKKTATGTEEPGTDSGTPQSETPSSGPSQPQKGKKKTATGTQGSGTEPGTATPPVETPPAGPSETEEGETPSPDSSSPSSWVNPAPTLITDSFSGVVVDPTKPPAKVTAYRTGNLEAGDSFSGTVTSDATDLSQLAGLVYQVVKKDPTGAETVVSQAPVSKGVYKGQIPAGAVAGGDVLVGELLQNGKQVGTATPVPIETQTATPVPTEMQTATPVPTETQTATPVPTKAQSAGAVPIETQTTKTTQPALTADSYKIPTLMQTGKPTAITFKGGDGDLTTTHVTVGGQPAQPLAEGPRETVFRSPVGVTGPATVTILKNGVTGSGESRNVAISLSAGSKALQTGSQEMLIGKVSGLTGLKKPVSVTLVNTTPAVQLQGGNKQTVTIAPSDVGADGSYTFNRDILAEHAGSFDVTATVDGLSVAPN